MYTSYFGFQDEPFSLTPTSRLFYSNPVYEKAYENLLRGIREHVGLMILTGEVGTGKTTLFRRIVNVLEEDPTVHVISSYYSTLTAAELLNFLSEHLGLATETASPAFVTQALLDFLHVCVQEGKTVTLFLDEAQDLEDEVLETLHRFVNAPSGEQKALQIVLVGQEPELGDKLALPRFRGLQQDLAVRSRLEHLKSEEVVAFIQHRLRLVGCEREDLFSPESLQLIARYSQGIPRLINLLCDNALRATHQALERQVSASILQKVAYTLRLAKREAPVLEERREREMPRTSRQEAMPADFAKVEPKGESKSFRSTFVWGGVGAAMLILLGVVFFSFSMRREGGVLSESSRTRFVEGVPQSESTTAELETLLEKSANLAVSVESASEHMRLDGQSINKGKGVFERLAAQRPGLQPLAWGVATASPAVALLLSEKEWTMLSKAEQTDLTFYVESLISTVRANPDLYIEEFQDTPLFEAFRAKVIDLCAECWVIGVGPLTRKNDQVLFDRIVVQGDALWAKSSAPKRGVKASEFRVGR